MCFFILLYIYIWVFHIFLVLLELQKILELLSQCVCIFSACEVFSELPTFHFWLELSFILTKKWECLVERANLRVISQYFELFKIFVSQRAGTKITLNYLSQWSKIFMGDFIKYILFTVNMHKHRRGKWLWNPQWKSRNTTQGLKIMHIWWQWSLMI